MVNGVNDFGVNQEEDFLSLAARPISLDVPAPIDPLSGTGPEEQPSRVRDAVLDFARPGTLFNALSRGFGLGTEEIKQRKREELADRIAEAEGEARIRALTAPPKPIERFETVFNDKGQPVGQQSTTTGKVIASPRAKARQEAESLRLEELSIKPTTGKGFTILDPETTLAAGFDKGTIVEEGPKGQKKVLKTPKPLFTPAERKEQRKMISDFNKLELDVNNTIDLIDTLVGSPEKGIAEHPGLRAAVGIFDQSFLSPTLLGDTRDFELRNEQLQGKNFLTAFQSLKGGGTITENEGKKAEAAQARLNLAQDEETYIIAVNEMRDLLNERLRRGRLEISVPTVTTQAQFDALKVGDNFIEDGIRKVKQ